MNGKLAEVWRLSGEEMRMRCGRACGWRSVRKWGSLIWGMDPKDCEDTEVPACERSLDAMYVLEFSLSQDERVRYDALLEEVVAESEGLAGYVWHARARLKCAVMVVVKEEGAEVVGS